MKKTSFSNLWPIKLVDLHWIASSDVTKWNALFSWIELNWASCRCYHSVFLFFLWRTAMFYAEVDKESKTDRQSQSFETKFVKDKKSFFFFFFLFQLDRMETCFGPHLFFFLCVFFFFKKILKISKNLEKSWKKIKAGSIDRWGYTVERAFNWVEIGHHWGLFYERLMLCHSGMVDVIRSLWPLYCVDPMRSLNSCDGDDPEPVFWLVPVWFMLAGDWTNLFCQK